MNAVLSVGSFSKGGIRTRIETGLRIRSIGTHRWYREDQTVLNACAKHPESICCTTLPEEQREGDDTSVIMFYQLTRRDVTSWRRR